MTPQNRDPNMLCSCIRGKYEELRDRLWEDHRIHVSLVETIRAADRQAYYIKSGVSWTKKSKHLAQPPRGLSLAADICPTEYLTTKGWDPDGEHWATLGTVAGTLGLTWGGTWKKLDLDRKSVV